jgi:hypothetical protein
MTTTEIKAGVDFRNDGTEAVYTVGNGNVIHYQRFGLIYFHADTPREVVQILNTHRCAHRNGRGHRIRIHFGETNASKPDVGRDWMEESDVEGYIGNSIGPLKVPLLLHSERSTGGGAVLDHCIVKITTTGKNKRSLYQHPNYHCPALTIREIRDGEKVGDVDLRADGYTHTVCFDGAMTANCKSLKAAERYIAKMS